MPSIGKNWRQQTINPDGTVSRREESTTRKLSYKEEGEPVKTKMKGINEVEADKYGGASLKNHVKLIIAERPIASEASVFESINSIQDNSLGIRNFCQTDNRQALKRRQPL